MILFVNDKYPVCKCMIREADVMHIAADIERSIVIFMADKFYAVKKGMNTGIFATWNECRACVHGYPNAEYKSFKTEKEAKAYLGNEIMISAEKDNITQEEVSEKEVRIYVDGSYNAATEEFSYGMVVLRDGCEEQYGRSFADKELAAMRNVAGEIKGAEAAMQYALDHKISKIFIYHDYNGIARWCQGDWKTNKDGTKAYKEFYDRAVQSVEINFVKVAGHSNDKYNDMADKLAKEALGLQ